MKRVFLILLAVVLAVSMVVVGCEPPEEEPETPAEFYQGKTITMYAGPAGSGVGVGAQLMAEYLAEEIGATILVEHFTELGGLKGYNELYTAPNDGLTMACHTLSTVFVNGLLEDPTALYDVETFIWLGSGVMAPMALWTHPEEYGNVTALMEETEFLQQAGSSPLGYMAFWGTLAGYWLGLDFETLLGVSGPPACKLSVEQKETDFTNIAIHTPGLYPDIIPVVLIHGSSHPTLYPAVPPISDVVTLNATEQYWLGLAEIASYYSGAGFAFPQGVDQAKVDYIRAAMDTVVADPAFIAAAETALGIWGWHDGDDVQDSLDFYIANLDELKDIEDLVRSYYVS